MRKYITIGITRSYIKLTYVNKKLVKTENEILVIPTNNVKTKKKTLCLR